MVVSNFLTSSWHTGMEQGMELEAYWGGKTLKRKRRDLFTESVTSFAAN
jgi:hypothetical protein